MRLHCVRLMDVNVSPARSVIKKPEKESSVNVLFAFSEQSVCFFRTVVSSFCSVRAVVGLPSAQLCLVRSK